MPDAALAAAGAPDPRSDVDADLLAMLKHTKLELPKFSGKNKELDASTWLSRVDKLCDLYSVSEVTKLKLASSIWLACLYSDASRRSCELG